MTLGRAVDRLALIQQHRDRLPMTAALIDRFSECPRELASTRLRSTVSDLIADERLPPALTVLARMAGLNGRRTAQLHDELIAALAEIENTLF